MLAAAVRRCAAGGTQSVGPVVPLSGCELSEHGKTRAAFCAREVAGAQVVAALLRLTLGLLQAGWQRVRSTKFTPLLMFKEGWHEVTGWLLLGNRHHDRAHDSLRAGFAQGSGSQRRRGMTTPPLRGTPP